MTPPPPELPARPEDGHKGTFGTVCVVGGQATGPRIMLGGPAFSALAALRVGCGLAVLAVPRPLMAAALTIAPEATGLALPIDGKKQLKASEVAELLDQYHNSFRCLAIGPGFGAEQPQQQIVVRLLAQEDVPMVVDADAINAMAKVRDVQSDLRASMVLTPHPGEYRRLAQTLGIDHDPIDPAQREEAASSLAQRLGCVVVLKGHRTVISDGLNTVVNETGGAALGTAGTGDVLTGLIAGLIAQFHKPALGTGDRQISAQQQGGVNLFDCARLGVHLHGRAGDLWVERNGDAGLLATDLLTLVPEVLRELRAARSL